MSYPKFFFHIQEDVLIKYFSLSSEDIKLIHRLRSDKNKVGFAVLLKSFQHLGYHMRRISSCADDRRPCST
jgi:hypothetical protein